MWAGGRVTLHRPLVLGRHATRRAEVVDRRQREGRSGPLTFVTIRHEVSQDGQIAVEEFLDVVYRAPAGEPTAGGAVAAGESDQAAGTPGQAGASYAEGAAAGYHPPAPDEVTLFRMSALTYNSHRIHYDREFARQVEGYRDLVVHGPLQALYMLEAARRWSREAGGGPITACSYRMVSPLLLGDGLDLRVEERSGGVAVTVTNRLGTATSSGTFDWGPPAAE
jgi:3-methylfumaryl-CoA hydratase